MHDFGEDRRPPGDLAVRQDEQSPDRGSRPLRVGADPAEHAPVLQAGEAELDRHCGHRGVGQPVDGPGQAVGVLLAALEQLGLRAEEETGVRQDAEAAWEEATRQEPDVGHLRRLMARIQAVLAPIAAGAAAGTATGVANGTAQLAQTVLTDLQQALP
ncbi:hypothetical protein ACFWZ2_13580 [Streptomyces sp. NPDC059002]|uniref:hypothetical protein n=1 Tax=Streptomyces sp. NPDC059002 TaxID=3346690 RepID=UPI003684AE2E